MGTSKGYIAPSTPHWVQAKRGVSMYINNPSGTGNIAAAASKYAKAMNVEGYSNSRVAHAFAGFASFASSSSTNGYANALREIGREDILTMDSEDAINELILHFANSGETIDDAIALDCISETFSVLNIEKIENLQNIEINTFIKEMVCQFAKLKFAQLFDKQIRNKCPNIVQANQRIAEMQNYIYYTMELSLTNEILVSINPHNLSNETIVQNVLKKGFELMELYYGDSYENLD
ncbi:hypothetical protein [uncultured Flavonifractor sp.]|uniref:Uncharacterized protein n=1 Tax=Candidatus Flavonifractor intestinigallinarum TaxID=2838586 RepID=A0A9D2SB31_9FIRM|nr:hypothetical protein [uncultured Flavonifractor sp.]HJB80299.1 hypothetical protein [Candidatus Flavonifractor intestinigallinarum]